MLTRPRMLQLIQPGQHNMTLGELRLLLALGLIHPTGTTPDGKTTVYSLTGEGRILAQKGDRRA